MRRFVPVLAVALVGLWALPAEAQIVPRPWYRGAGWGGAGWGGGGWGATTLQGSINQSYADVIRAQGEFNLLSSEAAINAQEAKSRYIDNSVKWLQAYYERKNIYRDQRDRELAQQRATRERLRNNREPGAPPRLTSSQLDPASGKIFWPDALTGPQFAQQRERLEELYVLRSHTSTSAQLAREIRDSARAMQADLKNEIREFLPNHYIEARRFLDSLGWEGQFPPGA